jgi:hypothetical protein
MYVRMLMHVRTYAYACINLCTCSLNCGHSQKGFEYGIKVGDGLAVCSVAEEKEKDT